MFAAPTVPPAPPWFSTITCWPSDCESFAESGRQKVSTPPPAGNGLRNVIGLFGHACACAANDRAESAQAAAARANIARDIRLLEAKRFPARMIAATACATAGRARRAANRRTG